VDNAGFKGEFRFWKRVIIISVVIIIAVAVGIGTQL
jgi:hypothetical protein